MMKRLILLLLAAFVPVLTAGAASVPKPESETRIVVQTLTAHLWSDEVQNEIRLTAVPASEIYMTKIRLEIDADGRHFETIRPETDYGYGPSVRLVDFEGTGFPQIFYSANSGGSGAFGFYYVFSVGAEGSKTTFDYQAFSRENRYSGRFEDGFRARIQRDNPSAEPIGYRLDVSAMDAFFRSKIFDEDGRVKSDEPIDVSDVNTVFPYYNSGMNANQLLVMQRATAVASVNQLGYVMTWLEWKNGAFRPYFYGFSLSPAGENAA